MKWLSRLGMLCAGFLLVLCVAGCENDAEDAMDDLGDAIEDAGDDVKDAF